MITTWSPRDQPTPKRPPPNGRAATDSSSVFRDPERVPTGTLPTQRRVMQSENPDVSSEASGRDCESRVGSCRRTVKSNRISYSLPPLDPLLVLQSRSVLRERCELACDSMNCELPNTSPSYGFCDWIHANPPSRSSTLSGGRFCRRRCLSTRGQRQTSADPRRFLDAG